MISIETDVPGILYKYRTLNLYTLTSLITSEVYLPRPGDLNDPFDCQHRIFTTPIPCSEFSQSYWGAKGARRQTRTLRPSDFSGDNYGENLISEIEFFAQSMRDLMANTGLYSLSETPLSTTMWAHYADSHQGICIGLSPQGLFDANHTKGQIRKVIYYPEAEIAFNAYPLYARTAGGAVEAEWKALVAELLTTKTEDWQYEKEWRFLFLQNGGSKLTIDINCIKELYFGLNTGAGAEKTIRQLLQNLPVRYYRMSRHATHHGLQIDNA